MFSQTGEGSGLDDALDRLSRKVEALSAENQRLVRVLADARRVLFVEKDPAKALMLLSQRLDAPSP